MNRVNYIAVDDEKVFLDALEKKLMPYDFLNQLALFINPFEAIDYIKQQQPSVIFLDFEMPSLSGKDILEQIDYEAQVIFITSHFSPMQEIINNSGKAIVRGYLSKPINESELKKVCLKIYGASFKNTSGKLVLEDGKKTQHFIDKDALSFVRANGKYTNWFFRNREPIKSIKIQLNEAEDLLHKNGLSIIRANKSEIVCDNGIIKRRTSDLIVHSQGSKNDIAEIAISDPSKFKVWLGRVFG